ncbi:hypothetical protein [Microbacterium deminutum]|uniref:Uncharacterized protein n=1 Tax=Microbacterium deminutum TaxID=344164 RepID=A0ABP5CCW8_9MICO
MDSNTDLWAIVNSFMIDCFHLTEAFSHGAGLTAQANAAADASSEIHLCRDYANTWKHFYRNRNVRVVYIWKTGDSESGGQFVEIGYRLRDEPDSSQTIVDAYILARTAWDHWRTFMSQDGLPEPTGLTQPYLDKLLAP